MNRLLRRFGARSWDAAVLAGVETDRASASSGTESDESRAATARFISDQASSGGAADRRWAAIGRGTPDSASMGGYGRSTSSEAGR
ncbi:hypothetical protein [Nocardia xishanensis]|uniref:hypothetical protein n=1 Tax=Nocardia xishanensis TaxID=238964 RepID=UPI00082D262C|nr:hypothetical protein [Nocardia xishanensis]